MLKRISIVGVICVVVFVSLAGALVTSGRADAAATKPPDKSAYMDQTIIYLKDTNRYYRDTDIFGTTKYNGVNWEHGYTDLNNPTGTDSDNNKCYNILNVPDFSKPGTVVLHEYAQQGGKCVATKSKTYTDVDSKNFNVNAYQIDDKTIYMPQFKYAQCGTGDDCGSNQTHHTGADGRFEANNATDANYCPDGTASAGVDKNQCVDYGIIQASGTGAGIAVKVPISSWQGTLVYINTSTKKQTSQGRKTIHYGCVAGHCAHSQTTHTSVDTVAVVFANGRAITQPPDVTGNPPSIQQIAAGDTGDTSTPRANDCDFGLSWNPVTMTKNALDWFGCTIISATITNLQKLSTSINSWLQTDLGNEANVQQVSNSFLTIANILFVISFLIMILSTALDIGFVDAYTVKKFLPRIIIAVILANLSFYLCTTVIHITNDIGGAVSGIILAPVGGVTGSVSGTLQQAFNSGGGASGIVGAGTAVGIGFAVSALATGGIFAIIPAILALLFGVMVAWAVIMIRRIIILLLVVVAPLAIVLWVIPGAESWAKRWWKLFIEMLLVYPIIMAILSAGMFTAALIGKSNTDATNWTTAISILACIILPYLLLPTVFKMASSTLGNVTGMINNKGKGIFDRGSAWGKERAKNTDRALAKDARKQQKLSLRQDRGRGRALERMTSGGVRGWNARRGLDAEDIDVLHAAHEEHQARRGTAQDKAKQARRTAAAATLSREMYSDNAVQNPDGTTRRRNRDEQMAYLEHMALNGTHEEKMAAIGVLNQQKEVPRLERVMTAASTNEAVRNAWNESVGENWDGYKSNAPHLASEVNAGDDVVAGWTNRFNTPDEQMAGMHVNGWQAFIDHNEAEAAQRYERIAGDAELSKKLTDDVHARFAAIGVARPTPMSPAQRPAPPGGWPGGTGTGGTGAGTSF